MARPTRLPRLRSRLTPAQKEARQLKGLKRARRRVILSGVKRDRKPFRFSRPKAKTKAITDIELILRALGPYARVDPKGKDYMIAFRKGPFWNNRWNDRPAVRFQAKKLAEQEEFEFRMKIREEMQNA